MMDVDGVNISIKCLNALKTTRDLDRVIIEIILVPFHLSTGMDILAMANVGMLV
jgi:hypothetical protein